MHNLRQAVRQNGLFVAVAVLLCLIAMASSLRHHLAESRFWRDLTGQTPFAHVVVEQVTATARELVLSGTLVKTRDCKTLGAPVAQVVRANVAYAARFHATEATGTPASRPPGPLPQAFGPWIISSPIPWPERVRLYRTHLCSGEAQTNLVFEIPWPAPPK